MFVVNLNYWILNDAEADLLSPPGTVIFTLEKLIVVPRPRPLTLPATSAGI